MEITQYDIAIVGGGIIGLASGFQLQTNFPNLRIVIFEKENELAFHQTGNNSGVIHSGLYYKYGSYKANNCVLGRKLLIQFAKENNIDFDVCGKLVVAVNNDEAERLIDLKKNGEKNGLIGLKILEPKEFKKIEPNISGVKALWVPQSGIIDYKSVTNKLAEKILSINSKSLILTGCKVLDFYNNKIITSKGNFYSRHNIFCGGLFSDRLAIKDQLDLKMQIVGFRGDYYKLSKRAEDKINNLVYPVPNPEFPFLGVHFT
ncbi:MAG: FAD-dependent oxidoreductase, partial [Flavobacteriales bacterium]|nr:FAD-dependent oxidoreductase [Flavobacteriales bacterium]